MKGRVDEFGRALVKLEIRPELDAKPISIDAWIDTAFNGELVAPSEVIKTTKLEQSAGIEATLADGNKVTLESYSCVVDWFGEKRAVEVISNEGENLLLGIGLLLGRRLVIDYPKSSVVIE